MKRRKALAKLAIRIKAYEDMCKHDPAGGAGYTKPGSMKGRK